MKAIILAAGEGKRLKPLTENKPKCMVKLFGKSLLEWQLNVFKNQNVTDISVVTGFYGNTINFPDIKYYTNEKFESTNMIETLFCAKEKLVGSVIVSYGDIIFERDVLQKLINAKDDFSIVVDIDWREYWNIRSEDPLNDAESLKLDGNGFIQSIGQQVTDINEIQGQYIGLMKFQGYGIEFLKSFYEKSKKQSIKNKNPLNPNLSFEKSFMTDLLQGMVNEGKKLKAISINNGWLELDTIRDYRIYEEMYSDYSISKFINLEKCRL